MTIRHGHKAWEVWLLDNGTLDTLIRIIDITNQIHVEVSFDQEFASAYRNKWTGEITRPGLRSLAVNALEEPDQLNWTPLIDHNFAEV